MREKKGKEKKRYTSLHTNILVEQDEWLDQTSEETGIPKAMLVREGIELLRQKEKESEK